MSQKKHISNECEAWMIFALGQLSIYVFDDAYMHGACKLIFKNCTYGRHNAVILQEMWAM